jgi:hypothetical protein
VVRGQLFSFSRICVHLRPSVVKLQPFTFPVPSGNRSFVCFTTTIRDSEQPVWASILWRAWEANSRKHLKLRYLHLIAANCNYLHLIAPNCTSCASCSAIFFLNLATLDFPRCPRPSPCSKLSQNHPASAVCPGPLSQSAIGPARRAIANSPSPFAPCALPNAK